VGMDWCVPSDDSRTWARLFPPTKHGKVLGCRLSPYRAPAGSRVGSDCRVAAAAAHNSPSGLLSRPSIYPSMPTHPLCCVALRASTPGTLVDPGSPRVSRWLPMLGQSHRRPSCLRPLLRPSFKVLVGGLGDLSRPVDVPGRSCLPCLALSGKVLGPCTFSSRAFSNTR
jgi:hypothetical protein